MCCLYMIFRNHPTETSATAEMGTVPDCRVRPLWPSPAVGCLRKTILFYAPVGAILCQGNFRHGQANAP